MKNQIEQLEKLDGGKVINFFNIIINKIDLKNCK